jgi:hypothetical protein
MMQQFRAFMQAHPYFSSYLFVFGLLQIGLLNTSGFTYASPLFFLFFVPFLLFYFGLPFEKLKLDTPTFNPPKLAWILLGLGGLVAILHLGWLGKIPFVEAWQTRELSEANLIRKIGSASLPKWLHYASTWSVRALLPASALFFLIKKNKIGFALSLSVGVLYGLALLQKSLVLWVSIPILVYFLTQRQWMRALLMSALTGLLFVLAIFANNPQLHGGVNDLKTLTPSERRSSQVSEGLFKRIFIVPGKTLSLWFSHVPKDKPFLKGRDLQFYAKLTGQKTADYNLELYPLFYPQYAKQGVKGSVNTAHFMRAYANFGWWGLPLAAAMLAMFFQLLNIVHRKTQSSLAFCLQIFPLLLLSSGSLLTLLFSGGWGLIILLLFIGPKPQASDV